jgi:hypothetical protein
MPYSEEQLERMDTDPNLRRCYIWQVGQKALLHSHELRAQGKLADAQSRARFGRLVLDNLDALAA